MTDGAGTVIGRLNAALEGRYRVERELGEGGMATVYLAQDLRHERQVALKVLKPELAAVVGAERFLAEIKTTAQLQHPHILPLHDSGEADSFLFYVMPYVEGESLREKLERERQLPVDEALDIAGKVGSALQHAHGQGVVHRDVKPANILMSQGQPLVADFGIALALSEAGDGRITETGLSLGTPHYMSPEQASGERTLDPRSDVYALGSVLYEMLTGQPPHAGPTAQAVLGSILTGDPRPPTELRKSVPANVDHAILRSLEKLPADRFESVAAFTAALRDPSFRWVKEGAAGGAAGPGPWKVASLLTGAVAILLAVAVGVGAFSGGEPPATERYRVVLSPWTVAPRPGWVQALVRLQPNGDGILFGDTTGSMDDEWILWFKSGDQTDPVPVPNSGDARMPAFSPDGQWIAFFTSDNELRKQPLQGGTSVLLADSAGSGTHWTLAWLPGGIILYEGADRSLRRTSEDGGPVETVATPDGVGGTFSLATPLRDAPAALVSVCPNGTCGGNVGQLWLVDVERDTLALLRENVVGAWHAYEDHVVYVDQRGAVFASPLDLDGLRLGTPVPLFDGVRASNITAEMQLDPDGTLLFRAGATASGNEQVAWVDRNGRVEPVDEGWRGDFESIALSPDGTLLAVTDESDQRSLWVKELPGPLTRLTENGANNRRPVWVPGTRDVAYQADTLFAFFRRRADASTPAEPLLAIDSAEVHQLSFSADGRYGVYRVNSVPDGDLRYMEIDGGDTTHHDLLVREGTNEIMPELSPDGRWLAYVSDVSGTDEVYVRPFPDVLASRTKVSDGGGWEPLWARDGSELFYSDGEGVLVAVRFDTVPRFRVVEREPLFNRRGAFSFHEAERRYDVASDGRFLFVGLSPRESGGNGLPDLILVDNWFTELRGTLERR